MQSKGERQTQIQTEREKERQHKQLSWFTSQTKVSPIPLLFHWIFHYIHTRLQMFKHTSKRFRCLTQEDFYNKSLTISLYVFTLSELREY